MRIAIVEDDAACKDLLMKFIHRFEEENSVSFACTVFTDGMELITGYQPVWDLILMDIEMPLLDGMSTARRVREADQDVLIIFITQMAQYAMEGYEVSALDYVLKPVNYYAFSMKMKRVLNILQKRSDSFLVIQNQEGAKRLSLNEIFYIEVQGHTLIYHTLEGNTSATGSRTIRNLEASLQGNSFVRCSQSFLVNLKYVESIEKDTIRMRNGDLLSISRSRRAPFTEALISYWG